MKTKGASGKKARTTKPTRSKQPTKRAKNSIILTSLAVGAAGILGYLGWQYYQKKRKASKNDGIDFNAIIKPSPVTKTPPGTSPVYPDIPLLPPTSLPPFVPPPVNIVPTRSSNTRTTTTTANGFPLKKGSKGTLVKDLQQALIAKYGASILPKYGADGDFGSETITALKKKGLPTSLDETNYYVIVQGSSSVTDKTSLAGKFLKAAIEKDFNAIISLLKLLTTKEDYRQVSNEFSKSRLRDVRQTLVNGLLGTFSSESQKQQIRYEFIRMGLKYNGQKWSLDGLLDGRPVVTIEPTNIWVNATQKVSVPAMVVLGPEVSRRLDYTMFENNGKYFLVGTKSIKYL